MLRLVTVDGKPVEQKPEQPKEGSPEWFASMRDAGYGGWGMMMEPDSDNLVVELEREIGVDSDL